MNIKVNRKKEIFYILLNIEIMKNFSVEALLLSSFSIFLFIYIFHFLFVLFFFNLHLAKSIMNECFVCVLFLLCFSFFFSFKFFCLCEKLFNEAYRELNFYEETKQNKRKKNCNRYVEESIEVVKIFLYVECRKCLI